MLKKNQLALVLLTLVLMLSIYYIQSPFKDDADPVAGNVDDTSQRLEALSELRLTLNDERNLRILELDSIIASSEATVSEKNVALEEKKYLISLTEKELLLETELITSGYQDVFVHASSYGVEITVISDTNSVLMASQIIKKAKEDFHDIESVQVIFKTESEVMGNATLS